MPKFNEERAASALMEALINGDKKAIEKYGVSLRSLQIWRERLRTDAHFASFFAMKKQALDAAWADDLSVPIRAAAKLITQAAEGADVITMRNPEFVHAIAGALKICAEMKIVCKVIDARTASADRQTDRLPGSVATERTATRYVS